MTLLLLLVLSAVEAPARAEKTPVPMTVAGMAEDQKRGQAFVVNEFDGKTFSVQGKVQNAVKRKNSKGKENLAFELAGGGCYISVTVTSATKVTNGETLTVRGQFVAAPGSVTPSPLLGSIALDYLEPPEHPNDIASESVAWKLLDGTNIEFKIPEGYTEMMVEMGRSKARGFKVCKAPGKEHCLAVYPSALNAAAKDLECGLDGHDTFKLAQGWPAEGAKLQCKGRSRMMDGMTMLVFKAKTKEIVALFKPDDLDLAKSILGSGRVRK